jgi:DNA-binding MarR family transcriptional regulator
LDAALLAVAYFYFNCRVFGAYMTAIGLSEAQRSLFRALRVVRDFAPPVSIRTVQHALALSHPAASRLIDRCVEEGFLARVESPADRRHAILTLTKPGGQATREVEEARQGVVEDLVAAWPADAVSSLIANLERLGLDLARLRASPPTPAGTRRGAADRKNRQCKA